jgi:hypothetical protein
MPDEVPLRPQQNRGRQWLRPVLHRSRDAAGHHGTGTGTDGFYVEAGSSVLQGNVATRNAGDGFDGAATVTENLAQDNGANGFEMAKNATGAGLFAHNHALHNGGAGATAENGFIPGIGNTSNGPLVNVNIARSC